MVEKAVRTKKVVSQTTLTSKKIKLNPIGEKIKCEYCKTNVLDIIRHLKKCHRNPQNAPNIELDWEYVDDYNEVKEFLIKIPCTDKEKEFNKIVAPNGNPIADFIGEMLDYTKSLPKAHKDAMINAKLDEVFTSGVNVKLLNKEEYFDRLKEKVRKGQRLFLLDSLKPITVEEIEKNKDILWEEPKRLF